MGVWFSEFGLRLHVYSWFLVANSSLTASPILFPIICSDRCFIICVILFIIVGSCRLTFLIAFCLCDFCSCSSVVLDVLVGVW